MRKLLLYNSLKKFCFVKFHKDDNSDYYSDTYNKFEAEHGRFYGIIKLYDDQMYNGIYYVYDLCRDGMIAMLVQLPQNSDAELKEAKALLYRDHDVVRCSTLKLKTEVAFDMPKRS